MGCKKDGDEEGRRVDLGMASYVLACIQDMYTQGNNFRHSIFSTFLFMGITSK
jgi:hypothetical protein